MIHFYYIKIGTLIPHVTDDGDDNDSNNEAAEAKGAVQATKEV